jgi:hypothetical protein
MISDEYELCPTGRATFLCMKRIQQQQLPKRRYFLYNFYTFKTR